MASAARGQHGRARNKKAAARADRAAIRGGILKAKARTPFFAVILRLNSSRHDNEGLSVRNFRRVRSYTIPGE